MMKKMSKILFPLLICMVLSCPINSSAQGPSALSTTNYEGIKHTIDTLSTTMLKYERGLPADLSDLRQLLVAPPHILKDRRDTYILNAARRLYVILQNVDYDPMDDIPQTIVGDRATVSLGDSSGLTVDIQFIKKQNGIWAISPATLESQHLREVYARLKERQEKLTRADMEGETFQGDLMSPFRTMLTFTSGIRGVDGFTMEDAVKALDMSEIDPVVQELVGPTLAVYLSRVLTFRSPLQLSELSSDPLSDKMPILLVIPKYGVVSLHVVEDPKTNEKAWKFTPNSLDAASNVYDEFMADGMAEMIRKGNPAYMVHEAPAHIMMDDFFQSRSVFLESTYLNINVWKWMLMGLTILGCLLLWFVIGWVLNGLVAFFQKHGPDENGYKSILLPLRVAVLASLWLQVLLIVTVNRDILLISAYLLDFIIITTSVWTAIIVVNNLTEFFTAKTRNNVRGTIIQVIGKLLSLVLLLTGAVAIASLLGQDSTRILTALGIGGIALALAGKDTVENFLGTAMIISTQPFAIGDWIIINGIEGTVESVGVRSTSIRTFHNSVVSVPNAIFVSSPVDNMGRRHYRRFSTTIGVEYDTPPNLIEAFVEGLREIVRSHPRTRKDYFHIQPNDFGASSVSILVYIFFDTDDWGIELQERGKFILDVLRLADELGIVIALPKQTVQVLQREESRYETPKDSLSAESLGKEAVLKLMNKDSRQ